MMLDKSFGKKIKDITYKDRIGAYAIIFDDNDKVAVVKTSTGYFLLGGGLDPNESHEDCIKRECIEEAGISVNVGRYICKGSLYHWANPLKYYIHGIGYFYIASIKERVCNPIEPDHELLWLEIEDCYDKLFLEHQA